MTFSKQVLDFYFHLPHDFSAPHGVAPIYPFANDETKRVMKLLFEKYYADNNRRTYILGINPGRFGSGITGIGFTDPNTLETYCDIPNSFEKRSELSSEFIFEVIEAYGGVEKFYADFYFTTVLPFGLIKENKNYNYYDDKETEVYFSDFIKESIEKQMGFCEGNRDIICIGQGKNLKYLEAFNKKYKLFDSISVIPHPRWVMQYRRKEKQKYINVYLDVLKKAVK